jgi:hypothetical protein
VRGERVVTSCETFIVCAGDVASIGVGRENGDRYILVWFAVLTKALVNGGVEPLLSKYGSLFWFKKGGRRFSMGERGDGIEIFSETEKCDMGWSVWVECGFGVHGKRGV